MSKRCCFDPSPRLKWCTKKASGVPARLPRLKSRRKHRRGGVRGSWALCLVRLMYVHCTVVVVKCVVAYLLCVLVATVRQAPQAVLTAEERHKLAASINFDEVLQQASADPNFVLFKAAVAVRGLTLTLLDEDNRPLVRGSVRGDWSLEQFSGRWSSTASVHSCAVADLFTPNPLYVGRVTVDSFFAALLISCVGNQTDTPKLYHVE